jgi:hypothetical protein
MGKRRGKKKSRRPESIPENRIGDDEPEPAESKIQAGRRSSGRLWLFRAVALLSPLLLLGLLEATLRAVDYGYPTQFFIANQEGDTFTSNLRFGWRFFPRALAREPVLLHTPKDKPDDVYRIFVLGGSAAQGVPDPAFSFGRILDVMLSEAFPGMEIEVINTAMTAINSHVVLPIARDIARLEPDLLLVYMGNNEIVGPYGAGSIFRGFAPNLPMVRASVALSDTRVGQLAEAVVKKLGTGKRSETTNWRGLEMFATLRDDG